MKCGGLSKTHKQIHLPLFLTPRFILRKQESCPKSNFLPARLHGRRTCCLHHPPGQAASCDMSIWLWLSHLAGNTYTPDKQQSFEANNLDYLDRNKDVQPGYGLHQRQPKGSTRMTNALFWKHLLQNDRIFSRHLGKTTLMNRSALGMARGANLAQHIIYPTSHSANTECLPRAGHEGYGVTQRK